MLLSNSDMALPGKVRSQGTKQYNTDKDNVYYYHDKYLWSTDALIIKKLK